MLYNQLGLRSDLCLIICLLAETYFSADKYRAAWEQTELAIATSSELGDRWCLPRIHMVRALPKALGQPDVSEASLRMAVDIAAGQSAKGAQLNATMAWEPQRFSDSDSCFDACWPRDAQ